MNLHRFLSFLFSKKQTVQDVDEFSYLNNPVILLSPCGKIVRCNDAVLDLYGVTPSEILKQDYFSFSAIKNIKPAFPSMHHLFKNPAHGTVTTVTHHEWGTKIFQWSASLVEKNGQIDRIYLQGFDVTAFTRTLNVEKKLKSSIIDRLPNHFIFWKDKNSVFMGCNEAFALGANLTSPAEIIGKTDYDMPWSKEESDLYVADDRQVMASRRPKLNIEESQTLPNGKKIILSTSKVPLLDEQGHVYGVLAVYSDITDQKINETKLIETNKKLEESYRVKSEFVRNVSHDIRTPLAGIQQTVRAIADGKISDKEVPEYALAAWEASNNLLDLFNSIIDVSKNEYFNFEDNPVKFDLPELLNGLLETYRVVAKNKGILFNVELSGNVPHYLIGKHLRLHRILMNLLGNALKFTETGSVRLVVEKANETDKDVILRFSVIDTGMGIPKQKHDFIFDPFSRLTPSFRGQYPGSGLGLHVVKEYIKKMQGEIYLESAVGAGSMFTCVIPFEKSILDNDNDVVEIDYVASVVLQQNVTAKRREIVEKPLGVVSNKLRVMLVEDNELARKMGVLILKGMGYQLDVAESGEEAVELAKQNVYDLIYMDIGLPGIDGIESVKRIRADEDSCSQHAFISALTAHADDVVTQNCLGAGLNYVLTKPLSPEKAEQLQVLFSELRARE